jgi:hypothetical protein
MLITFPSKTAKQIVDECDNKLNGHKFLYDTDWYKDEDFFTKEKCREGTREIITDLTDTLGKTWDACKEKGEMLNFAELLWCVIQIPDFLKKGEYSWTSSRTSDGYFVNAGDFDDDGGDVNGLRPGSSRSYIGCAFSRSDALKSSNIDTLTSDNPSRAGADWTISKILARIEALEEWQDRVKDQLI